MDYLRASKYSIFLFLKENVNKTKTDKESRKETAEII